MSAANPIIHRRPLFGGVTTAEELHAKTAFHGARCDACGGPPAIRIQIFIRLSDMSPTERTGAELAIRSGQVKPVKLATGPALLWSRVHACRLCQRGAERAAARGPSYCIVDISRGPGADAPSVAVPSTLILG